MYKNVSIDNVSFIRKKKEILILNNNNFLYYQTCKGICFNKINNDRNFVWIHFLMNSENKQKTIIFLKRLESKIRDFLPNNEIINPFITDNGIGVSIQHYAGKPIIDCYLAKDIKMNIEEVPEKFYIIPILWFHNLKYSGDRWYINIKLVQCLINPIYQRFTECLIDDRTHESKEKKLFIENTTNKIKLIEHPIYGKYFKMINMGIPHLAVEIKLKNELGENKIEILKKRSDELIEIKWVKYKEHKCYFKYFKMMSMGVPRNAIESKMLLDNVDISILNVPDKMIIEVDEIRDDFISQLNKKRLKKTRLSSNHIQQKSEIISKDDNRINLKELMEKRMKILNK